MKHNFILCDKNMPLLSFCFLHIHVLFIIPNSNIDLEKWLNYSHAEVIVLLAKIL